MYSYMLHDDWSMHKLAKAYRQSKVKDYGKIHMHTNAMQVSSTCRKTNYDNMKVNIKLMLLVMSVIYLDQSQYNIC